MNSDKTRQDKTRQDKTRQDKTRQDNDSASSKHCQVERLGNIYGPQFGTSYAGNVWNKFCISPALMTMQGGNREPMIIVRVN